MEFFIIELKIIDINDNQPIFNPSHYKIIISESDKPGMIYRLPIAFDQDIGMNSMLFYNIVSINGTNNQGNIIQLYSINNNNNNSDYNENIFILIQETNPKLPFIALHSLDQIEIHKLYIKLIQPLDRELYHHYDIIIIAMDKPLTNHHHHQKTGTLNLIIEIADINDELPKFQYKQYEFHIQENSPSGSIIGQVNAIDLDDGLNSMINYTIKEMKPFINHNHNNHDYYDYYNELIYIDSITGEIKLYTMIDREKLLKIHLIIEAKDNGQPSRSSLTNVIIHIDDINDNSPIIELWGYKEILNSTGLLIHNNDNNNNNIHHSNLMPFYLISSQGPLIPVHIWVSEYLNPRSILSIVKVNDLDQGFNGTVQCILNDSYFILQPATPNTNTNNDKQLKSYYVILSKSLDYELQIIHHIPIICYDLGIPLSKTSTVLLNIHIKDENDNEPKFLLPEIVQPAQWINKEQFLSNKQQMNNNLNSIFDFHKTLFNLKMIPLEINIPETCSINSVILKFPVLDIDNGINSLVNYQIQLINQYPINQYNNNQSIEIDNIIDFIQINNQTGQIIIIKSLKLIPEYIKYIYELIVTDQGIPSRLSKLYFSLQIIIVNSYPPNIELIQLNNNDNQLNITIIELYKNNFNKKYEIEFYENQPMNIELVKLIGYDPDRGDAGRISYKLIQNLMKTCKGSYQQLNNTIEIDSNNGIITIMKSLDRELDGNLILLTIHIHDHGIPMYTTTIYIDIKILDRNDNPPLFILPLRSCHKLDLINDTTNLYDVIPCNNVLHNNHSHIIILLIKLIIRQCYYRNNQNKIFFIHLFNLKQLIMILVEFINYISY
ncbi:unnamed protein product [Schistosoma mattheei]|uniref:Cadherin domain-containing protein n=1 Tax=Schistosoma mattheei TaxID=31246 RepID=A0AA85BXK8_9TREM|nr:unnamed protein product [Schistosoma mattheei]